MTGRAWKRCLGCGKSGYSFGPRDCSDRVRCASSRKVVAEHARRYGDRHPHTIPAIKPESPLHLTPDQLEEAARFASRCEGLNPDGLTCAGRPQWQVFADLIREQYLPAINHALAGVLPEGSLPCPAEPSGPPSQSFSPTSPS